ncbi:MAG: hypothetical protein QM703_23000 [Gemmatales bacterium]
MNFRQTLPDDIRQTAEFLHHLEAFLGPHDLELFDGGLHNRADLCPVFGGVMGMTIIDIVDNPWQRQKQSQANVTGH